MAGTISPAPITPRAKAFRVPDKSFTRSLFRLALSLRADASGSTSATRSPEFVVLREARQPRRQPPRLSSIANPILEFVTAECPRTVRRLSTGEPIFQPEGLGVGDAAVAVALE